MSSISYIRASGKDINLIVDRIEDAVDGEPSTHVSIACLVVAIMAQKPDIEPQNLQDTIKSVSELLVACLFDEQLGSVN